jgi:hypothetical protein
MYFLLRKKATVALVAIVIKSINRKLVVFFGNDFYFWGRETYNLIKYI